MSRLTCVVVLVLVAGCGPQGSAPQSVTIPPPKPLQLRPPGIHRLTADVPGGGQVKYAIKVPQDTGANTPLPLVLVLHYGYEGSKPPGLHRPRDA